MSSEFENLFTIYDLDILAYGALSLNDFFLTFRKHCVRSNVRDALTQEHGVITHDTRISGYKNYSGF
jgi:hypothetical protein